MPIPKLTTAGCNRLHHFFRGHHSGDRLISCAKPLGDGGDVFFESASKYISGLDRDAFSPDMAGVRPVLKGGGRDFIIREESGRGFGGFINLIGIESPGLTASLSIAEHVKALITDL